MSLGTGTSQRSASPLYSGTALSINSRSRNLDDDISVKKDKGYRRYASGVERVLSQFETALEEWADYISFLGRLHKALQAKPSIHTEIPHKALVAKRLSQCLNPVLPSGVHQKTLDVYAYIFASLGSDNLSKDLSLYLPGLAPVLSFASLSVKPTVLTLFEKHILKVDSRSLRPASKAIILSLLPGLEEESSEEFERTLSLLEKLKETLQTDEQGYNQDQRSSGQQYFWQCLFLASITNPSRRSGALAYLIRNLPRLGPFSRLEDSSTKSNGQTVRESKTVKLSPEVEAVTSPDPGLLIRCFCAGLRDEQLLIQRGFLDLLVTHIPLHSTVFSKQVAYEDLVVLVAAASSVVARRDMSLNRRLWSWFLGPEPQAEAIDHLPVSEKSPKVSSPGNEGLDLQSAYFERYGLKPLVSSIIKSLTSESSNASERARPLKVCTSLMDRWEIGGLVVPQIFSPAIRSVWRYQDIAPSRESYAEVLRSANVFFDGVESNLIWTEIYKIITISLDAEDFNADKSHDLLELVLFMTTKFNLKEEEMLVVHIPVTCLILLIRVQIYLKTLHLVNVKKSMGVAHIGLRIVNRLIDLIPDRAFIAEPTAHDMESSKDKEFFTFKDHELLARTEHFYAEDQGNLDLTSQPFSSHYLGSLMLSKAIILVSSALQSSQQSMCTETMLAILDTLIRKVPSSKSASPDLIAFRASLSEPAETNTSLGSTREFSSIACKISVLEIMCTAPTLLRHEIWVPKDLVRQLIPTLITALWPSLSPSQPKYNVEAVRYVWRLQSISPDQQLVESTLASLLIASIESSDSQIDKIEGARRFSILWTHSPLASAGTQSRRSSVVQVKKTPVQQEFKSQRELSALERPLLLLLDALEEPYSELFLFVASWLQSLPNLDVILDLLIGRLQNLKLFAELWFVRSNDDDRHNISVSDEGDDLELCMYYLRIISHLISYSATNAWEALTSPSSYAQDHSSLSMQVLLTKTCIKLLGQRFQGDAEMSRITFQVNKVALSLIRQFLLGPSSTMILELEIELPLIEELISSVDRADTSSQVPLMEVLLIVLKGRFPGGKVSQSTAHRRITSRDTIGLSSSLSVSTDKSDQKANQHSPPSLPAKLMQCLTLGLTSRNSRPVLESWIRFLDHCLPLYEDNVFQVLLPLVECLCNTLGSVFKSLRAVFEEQQISFSETLEPTLGFLLNGLEQSLATAHDRLMAGEIISTPIKSPEVQQSFFGNMVSGVFTSDTNRSRTMTANNRLTVLLCFKDSIRICYGIWSWGEWGNGVQLRDPSASASFNYTTLRLRNRTRRIFEHLFAAEALESLETLIELWCKSNTEPSLAQPSAVFNLINVLDGSRPRNAMPAMFNAIYSRTNPSVLDPVRKSTLTSNLSDMDLSAFLVEYVRSLDDDAMDEIWNDCMTFLRDVLANPMPHRQMLARLVEFTGILGQKVDNTNFGEQRKMRRELGDLFVRLLTATLTIKPLGFSHEASQASSVERLVPDQVSSRRSFDNRISAGLDGIVPVLAVIIPDLSKILVDTDRITATATLISTQVLSPTFRSKAFPENLTRHTLDLLMAFTSMAEASKSWKKDATEAFSHPRFFASPPYLAEDGWLPILRQLALADKDRMPDLISRLPAPTGAGLVFGVGASSTRLEADRKTQLNLRRIASLILAVTNDTFVASLPSLQEKLVELMNATTASSPSSITRAEVYMVIRALVLKTSTVHLSSYWPTINSELYDMLSSAYPVETQETPDAACLLQACKLLDILLTLGLDDFQMQEWLFITDTTDAVYRPANCRSTALVDGLAEGLDFSGDGSQSYTNGLISTAHDGKRKPLLTATVTKDVPKEEMMGKVLRPFFRQLSIYAFESTYGMEAADWKACVDDLILDLFDDSTLV